MPWRRKPRCPAHRFVCVPFFTAARKSLCACFPAEAGRSLRAAVCEAVHGSDVFPFGKRLAPALRCAQRYAEVKGEPLGCEVQEAVLRRRSIRSPCVCPCLPVLFFAAARELSHVCLSAEVACLRCAAYEAVREIRSGRDKLSVLLDAEVAYGFGVIPLVQRLAPALHRVKRCAEAEGTTGRKGGAACRGCGQSTVPARCFVRVCCFSQPRGSFRTPVFRRKRGPRFAPPYLRRCALSVQFRSDGGRPPAFFAREAAHGFDVSPLGRRLPACLAREAVTQLRRNSARPATATLFALRETVRRSRGAVSPKAKGEGPFRRALCGLYSERLFRQSSTNFANRACIEGPPSCFRRNVPFECPIFNKLFTWNAGARETRF